MEKYRNAVLYVIFKYPGITRSELAKVMYLLDYNYALMTGETYSSVNWYFNHHGPFVTDFESAVKNAEEIEISQIQKTLFMNEKTSYYFKGDFVYELDSLIRSMLDEIIEIRKNTTYKGFIKYIYSTFPVKNSKKHSYFSIPELVSKEKLQTAEDFMNAILSDPEEIQILESLSAR